MSDAMIYGILVVVGAVVIRFACWLDKRAQRKEENRRNQ